MICEECDRAERGGWWLPLASLFLILLCPPRPSPLAGMASVMTAALGGPPPPTHYERHRQAWVETGDLRELDRMVALVR